jgi:hypothetical protein
MRSVSPRWVRHSHPNPSTSNIASDQTTPDIILETLIAWGRYLSARGGISWAAIWPVQKFPRPSHSSGCRQASISPGRVEAGAKGIASEAEVKDLVEATLAGRVTVGSERNFRLSAVSASGQCYLGSRHDLYKIVVRRVASARHARPRNRCRRAT